MFYDRFMSQGLKRRLQRPFVDIVFGARQTGKTCLLQQLLEPSISYNLADPAEHGRLAADPGAFRRECEALPETGNVKVVFVDEAQLLPSIFDSVQVLYDIAPDRWKFVLCGSSARKLRAAGANLLPGRAVLHHLHPLVIPERTTPENPSSAGYILPLDWQSANPFPEAPLEHRLAYGDLPGIARLEPEDKQVILSSYADIHLHEEIRREGLVRDWGAFINFLRLAAAESGNTLNYSKLSTEVGVSVPTIKSHYQLLEDMFVGFSVRAFSGSPRKNLLSTPRFLFFDIGVRHAAAGITPGPDAVAADPGGIFEQWVGAELYRRLAYLKKGKLSYLRTKSGAEIDYIVELEDRLLPIEVKWTSRPTLKDTRHLSKFIEEQPRAKDGFIICRCPRPQKMSKQIYAIPWHML